MRNIAHPIVIAQVAVPQPRLVVVALCLFGANWLPTLIAYAMMQWSVFSDLATQHSAAYQIAFFFTQLGLIFGGIALLSRKYLSAVWTPQPPWRRGFVVSLLVLLPLLLFHLPDSIGGIRAAIALSGLDSETLASVYDGAWGRLSYGSSRAGVVCSSVMSFAAPVLEELVFTGFVVNAIAKPYGFLAAVVGAAACFALVHAFQFGVGLHLLALLFAGLTYAIVRVRSGSVLFAMLGHWTINFVIFLPKWVVAFMHFKQV